MSCLVYQIECHKQARHSPLIPLKQNLTRETLEYNTLRVTWVGLAEWKHSQYWLLNRCSKNPNLFETNAKQNMPAAFLSTHSSLFHLPSLLGGVPNIVGYL